MQDITDIIRLAEINDFYYKEITYAFNGIVNFNGVVGVGDSDWRPSLFKIVRKEGKIIAFIIWSEHKNNSEIEYLFVVKEERNKDIGECLVKDICLKHKYCKVKVDKGTEPFWEHMGFRFSNIHMLWKVYWYMNIKFGAGVEHS